MFRVAQIFLFKCCVLFKCSNQNLACFGYSYLVAVVVVYLSINLSTFVDLSQSKISIDPSPLQQLPNSSLRDWERYELVLVLKLNDYDNRQGNLIPFPSNRYISMFFYQSFLLDSLNLRGAIAKRSYSACKWSDWSSRARVRIPARMANKD